jgi:glycosyltransferase involved in cell wall biosynthesis
MDKTIKPLNILIISFDWRNLFESAFDELKAKFERDRLNTDFNNFFLISWSDKTYYAQKENFATEHLRAAYKHFRVLYDLLLIFYVPFILWRRKFKPDIIWIKEFPILFSAIIPKLVYGSKVMFLLSATPVSLAKTRQMAWPRVLYQQSAEFVCKHFADYYFANGQATKEYLVNLGIDEGRVEIKTGNVIDRDQEYINNSKKGKIRSEYNISENQKIILTVGRLESEKGHDRLFKAIKDTGRQDLVLFVLGEGSLKENLKSLALELGIEKQVFFTGNINREKIWDYYNDADVFMLMSYSDGCPTVVREAMYMGVPVIGSRIASIEEFLGKNEERGFLWVPEDGIDKLQILLEKCFNGDENVTEMKKQARQYVVNEIAGGYTVNDYLKP